MRIYLSVKVQYPRILVSIKNIFPPNNDAIRLALNVHRPQNVYGHQSQLEICDNHQIRWLIYRQPNVAACWILAWSYIIWSGKITSHCPLSVAIEVNLKLSFQDESHIFSFIFDHEYYDGIVYDNNRPKVFGLEIIFATDVAYYTYIFCPEVVYLPIPKVPISSDRDDIKSKPLIMAFNLSVKQKIEV